MKAPTVRSNDRLQERIEEAVSLVDAQAEDDGLWFIAESIVEAYFQQELRRLHEAVEAIKEAFYG